MSGYPPPKLDEIDLDLSMNSPNRQVSFFTPQLVLHRFTTTILSRFKFKQI